MAFEKAARGETQRLWREEVPCALASVRAEFQPSVWCVHMYQCANLYVVVRACVLPPTETVCTRKITVKKTQKAERRETKAIAQVKAEVIPPRGCTSPLVLPWPFCSLLLDRQRTGIQCGVSLKENIHYSSQQRREHTNSTEEGYFLWEKIVWLKFTSTPCKPTWYKKI